MCVCVVGKWELTLQVLSYDVLLMTTESLKVYLETIKIYLEI